MKAYAGIRRFPVLFAVMAALMALVLLLNQNPPVAYSHDWDGNEPGNTEHDTIYLECPDTEILEGSSFTVYVRRVDGPDAREGTFNAWFYTEKITTEDDDHRNLDGNKQYSNKSQSDANRMPRSIPTYQDNLIEGNETFKVRISGHYPITHNRPGSCTITIIDEDLYITSMSVANRPRYGDTFGAGEDIEFRVAFNSWVEVEGNVLFKFNMGDEERKATFREMEDNFTLIFAYTVLWNDLDTDGVSIGKEPIGGSGTINYWRTDIVPYLKTSGLLQLADRAKVLGSPRVVGIDVTSSPVNGSTYGIGEHLELTATFSEPVRVDGDVRIPIWVGDPEDSSSRRSAVYDRGTGTDKLVFRYEVAAGDRDDDGFAIRAGLDESQTFEGGGGIRSMATQVRRDPIYPGQDDLADHKVNGALDLRLDALTVSGGSLSPEFSPQVTDYEVVFPRRVTRATIGGEADEAKTVSYGPEADAEEGEAGYQVDLEPGKNGVTVTVGAADPSITDTRTYTVTINRASSDATLRSLSLNRSSVPGFHPGASIYALDMDGPRRVTTLDAAATDDQATVAFDVPDDDPDDPGHQVVLNEGTNRVTMTVTAEDRVATRKYSLTASVADVRDDRGSTARATVDPEKDGANPIHYWGSVREAGDVDWIRVVLEADRMYHFTLRGSVWGHGLTLGSPLIAGLYDADGQHIPGTLKVGNAGVSGNESNARLHYMPVTGGDYFLAVRGVQEQTGTYALRVVVVPDDLQPNNASTPGVIAMNATARGVIDYRGDSDWYRMELQGGVRYGTEILRSGTWRRPFVSVRDHMGNKVPVDYLESSTYWRPLPGYLHARGRRHLLPVGGYVSLRLAGRVTKEATPAGIPCTCGRTGLQSLAPRSQGRP